MEKTMEIKLTWNELQEVMNLLDKFKAIPNDFKAGGVALNEYSRIKWSDAGVQIRIYGEGGKNGTEK